MTKYVALDGRGWCWLLIHSSSLCHMDQQMHQDNYAVFLSLSHTLDWETKEPELELETPYHWPCHWMDGGKSGELLVAMLLFIQKTMTKTLQNQHFQWLECAQWNIRSPRRIRSANGYHYSTGLQCMVSSLSVCRVCIPLVIYMVTIRWGASSW